MCCLHSSGRASGLLSWFASWVTFPICPIFSGVFSVMSFARSARSGHPCAMTRATLLSPWVVVTAFVSLRTMNDYAHGRAFLHPQPVVMCCGERNKEAGWTVSPKTRLPIVAEPARSGASWFIWRVNDRVARQLFEFLGPQRGSWTSDVPTSAEVGAALKNGRAAKVTDLLESAPDLVSRMSITPVTVGTIHRIDLQVGTVHGLKCIGTGPEFFVLVDPTSNREVARFEAPSR